MDTDVAQEFMPPRKRLSLRPEIEFVVEPQAEVVVEPQAEEVVVEPQAQGEELPERYKEKIMQLGGTEETLILKRTLTRTDVHRSQAHLSIPMRSLLTQNFLMPDEKEEATNRVAGDKGGGLTVRVIDPKLNEWELKLRAKTRSIYSLAKEWNHVVTANELSAGDRVQLWSFRSQRKLCIAIVSLREEERQIPN